RMLDADKIYAFTIQFGEETATLDTEGEVTERSDRRPPMAAIAGVLDHFTGPIEQVPPAYSALKIDGKRAYDRARAGETVEMKTRAVTVHDLYLAGHPREGGDPDKGSSLARGRLDPRLRGGDDSGAGLVSTFQTTAGRPDPYDPQAPLELADSVTLVAHVSKGTYIRSLARDIARALGTLGHVT
ncbi:MAG TPA: tRNA pseudouridine(55) synthase, partial [Erythrobacter sp.]|nr:tRNA pseudouridine(55) synthase [Erythrobacter sp.]